MSSPGRTRFGEAAIQWRRAGLVDWCRRIVGDDLDIETIHQARVGTRRFRAALRMFADLLPKAERRAWRDLSKRLADALGTVRDTDVFLRHLAGIRPAGDPERARALRFVRNRTRLTREEGLPALRQLAAEFILAAETLGPVAAPSKKPPPSMAGVLPLDVRSDLAPLLADLFEHERAALLAADFSSAHAMRIAAKQLRYALELLDATDLATEKPALRDAMKAAAHVQGGLGHVQDHHVWKGRFAGMKRDVGKWLADPALERALQLLSAHEKTRRNSRLAHFVSRWRRPSMRRAFEQLRGLFQ